MLNDYRKLFILLVCISLLNLIIINLIYFNETKQKKVKIHVCLRTKDSSKYIDEFLRFHAIQGITSFSIYDDSEEDNYKMYDTYPYVTEYKHVWGVKIPNENYHIWDCMTHALTSGKYDYVMNMDDDEFVFPVDPDTTIGKLLERNDVKWFGNHWCISNPVLFFGSIQSQHTGFTTIDFVNRDRPVDPKDTTLDVEFARYVNARKNSRGVKKRIEKAIFKVPENIPKLISLLGNYIREGVLIHGYGLKCYQQHYIKVAHYTRSDIELNARISKFWKNVHGLTKRFDNKRKINDYLKERNRTEYVDETIRKISIKNLLT